MGCRHSLVRTTSGIMVCTECGAEVGRRRRDRRRWRSGRRRNGPRRRAALVAAVCASALVAAAALAMAVQPQAAQDALRQAESLAGPLADGAAGAAGAAAGAARDARELAEGVLPPLEPRIDDGAASSVIHNATNEARAAAGLPPLARDARLDGIARGHAEDMAERGYFMHDSPEGLDPTDRAAAAGYACEKRVGAVVWTGVGENIYMSGHAAYTVPVAAGAVDSWMDSPGHRQNILDGRYDRLGVGVAIGGGDFYAVQNFC